MYHYWFLLGNWIWIWYSLEVLQKGAPFIYEWGRPSCEFVRDYLGNPLENLSEVPEGIDNHLKHSWKGITVATFENGALVAYIL